MIGSDDEGAQSTHGFVGSPAVGRKKRRRRDRLTAPTVAVVLAGDEDLRVPEGAIKPCTASKVPRLTQALVFGVALLSAGGPGYYMHQPPLQKVVRKLYCKW